MEISLVLSTSYDIIIILPTSDNIQFYHFSLIKRDKKCYEASWKRDHVRRRILTSTHRIPEAQSARKMVILCIKDHRPQTTDYRLQAKKLRIMKVCTYLLLITFFLTSIPQNALAQISAPKLSPQEQIAQLIKQTIGKKPERVDRNIQNESLVTNYELQVADSAITIPSSFGTVTSYINDNSTLEIALINDAHCHYDAQMNESQIIKTLIEDYGYEAIYIEGAVGRVDTAIFTAYPYRDVKEKVFKKALKNGEINGADYYAIMRDKKLTWMHGVEDEKLYRKNYEAAIALIEFAQTAPARRSYELWQGGDHRPQATDQEFKPQITPINTDKFWKKSKSISEDLRRSVALKNKPQSAQRNEDKINNSFSELCDLRGKSFLDVIEEVKTQLAIAKNKTYSRKLKKLDRLMCALTTEHAEKVEKLIQLLAHIFAYVEKYTLDVSGYEEIEKLRNILISNVGGDPRIAPSENGGIHVSRPTINAGQLLDDINAFADYLKNMLFRNSDERAIDEAWRWVVLLEKGANLELTRSEWYSLRETIDHRPQTTDFWKGIGLRSAVSCLQSLNEAERLVVNFYRLVEKRDEVMLGNLLKYAKENGQKKVIFITGGFHGEALIDKLLHGQSAKLLNGYTAKLLDGQTVKLLNGYKPNNSAMQQFNSRTVGPSNNLTIEQFNNITIHSIIPNLNNSFPDKSLYLTNLLARSPTVSTLKLVDAFEAGKPVVSIFKQLHIAHQKAFGECDSEEFRSLITKALRELYVNSGRDMFQLSHLLFSIQDNNYQTDLDVINPLLYDMDVQVREGISEQYRAERGLVDGFSHGLMIKDGERFREVEPDDLRKVRLTIADVENVYMNDDRYETVSVISNGNLYNNDHFIVWKDGRLYCRYDEPIASRKYTCIVVWNDGHVSGEKLEFRAVESKKYEVRRVGTDEDLANQIKFASYGQQLLANGEPVDIADLAEEFDDLYHLFKFPQVHKEQNNGVWGPAIGAYQLYKKLPNKTDYEDGIFRRKDVRQLLNGQSVVIDTSIYEQHIVQRSLDARYYVEVRQGQELQEGQYRWLDAERKQLEIVFYRYRLSHSLLGITASGKVVTYVIAGNKHSGLKGIGCTPEEAREVFNAEWNSENRDDPLSDIFLISNGMDAMRRENGKTIIQGMRKHYSGATSMYVFAKHKKLQVKGTKGAQSQLVVDPLNVNEHFFSRYDKTKQGIQPPDFTVYEMQYDYAVKVLLQYLSDASFKQIKQWMDVVFDELVAEAETDQHQDPEAFAAQAMQLMTEDEIVNKAHLVRIRSELEQLGIAAGRIKEVLKEVEEKLDNGWYIAGAKIPILADENGVPLSSDNLPEDILERDYPVLGFVDVVTASCGFVSRAVDCVAISPEGEVVMMKRANEPYNKTWTFPGGRLQRKDGNSIKQMMHEVQEELYLEDAPKGKLTFINKRMGFGNRNKIDFYVYQLTEQEMAQVREAKAFIDKKRASMSEDEFDAFLRAEQKKESGFGEHGGFEMLPFDEFLNTVSTDDEGAHSIKIGGEVQVLTPDTFGWLLDNPDVISKVRKAVTATTLPITNQSTIADLWQQFKEWGVKSLPSYAQLDRVIREQRALGDIVAFIAAPQPDYVFVVRKNVTSDLAHRGEVSFTLTEINPFTNNSQARAGKVTYLHYAEHEAMLSTNPYTISVTSTLQEKGIGTALFTLALRDAYARGVKTFHVHNSRYDALSFYAQFASHEVAKNIESAGNPIACDLADLFGTSIEGTIQPTQKLDTILAKRGTRIALWGKESRDEMRLPSVIGARSLHVLERKHSEKVSTLERHKHLAMDRESLIQALDSEVNAQRDLLMRKISKMNENDFWKAQDYLDRTNRIGTMRIMAAKLYEHDVRELLQGIFQKYEVETAMTIDENRVEELIEKEITRAIDQITENMKQGTFSDEVLMRNVLDNDAIISRFEKALSAQYMYEQSLRATYEEFFPRHGLVAFNGGGGARLVPRITDDQLFKHAPNQDLLMVVPAEDDGGSTAKIAHIYRTLFNVILPAMGDTVNAMATLAERDGKEYLYRIIRHRMGDEVEGEDLADVFWDLCARELAQLTDPKRAVDRAQLLEFRDSMMEYIAHFDQHAAGVPLVGQSMGNMLWLATAHATVKDLHEATRQEMRTLSNKELLAIQSKIAQALKLKRNLVIPSNTNPGTLYAILEQYTNPEAVDNHAYVVEKNTVWLNGMPYTLTEDDALQSEHVSPTAGFSFIDMPLPEGATLMLFHQNKANAVAPKSWYVSLIKRTARGYAIAHKKSLARPAHMSWIPREDEWEELTDVTRTIGCGVRPTDFGMEMQTDPFIDQLLWGATVSTHAGGLRIGLDRVGTGTYIGIGNETEYAESVIKGRVVVKQTNITESRHDTKIKRVGFVDDKKLGPVAGIMEAITTSDVGCIIGPGSTVTSVLPMLMIPEVRAALRVLKEKGKPIIFVVNATKDNETAFLDTLTDLVDFIEYNCDNEPIFGPDGFVTELIVNDTSHHNWDLIKQYAHADPKHNILRPAEHPRGFYETASGAMGVRESLLGHINRQPIATTRHVRNREPGDYRTQVSIVYDEESVRAIMRQVLLAKQGNVARETALYQEVYTWFDHNAVALERAIRHEHARNTVGVIDDAIALERIRDVIREKDPLGEHLSPTKHGRTLVMNASETVIDAGNERVSNAMRDALIKYLRANSQNAIVLLTGHPFKRIDEAIIKPLKEALGAEANAYLERLYVLSNSGADVRKGEERMAGFNSPDALTDDDKACVRDVLSRYGLKYEDHVSSRNGDGNEAFISLRFANHGNLKKDYTNLGQDDVDAINRKADQRLINWHRSGLQKSYDIRDSILVALQKELEGRGIYVDKKGRRSIDITTVDETQIARQLLGIDALRDAQPLFFLADEKLVELANKRDFQHALKLALPAQYPPSLTDVVDSLKPDTFFDVRGGDNPSDRTIAILQQMAESERADDRMKRVAAQLVSYIADQFDLEQLEDALILPHGNDATNTVRTYVARKIKAVRIPDAEMLSGKVLTNIAAERSEADAFVVKVVDDYKGSLFALPIDNSSLWLTVYAHHSAPTSLFGSAVENERERSKFATVLNRITNDEAKLDLFKKVTGLDDADFYALREIRQEGKQGNNDKLNILSDDSFTTFIEHFAQKREMQEDRARELVITVKEKVDRFIDQNDFFVEMLDLELRNGTISYDAAMRLLYLQQIYVGVVEEKIVKGISNVETVSLNGYDMGFQYNPERENRGKTGDKKPYETFLDSVFIKRCLPLERYLPYSRKESKYDYMVLPNPFPHLRNSMIIATLARDPHGTYDENGDVTAHFQQAIDVDNVVDMFTLLEKAEPAAGQERFRLFLNARYAGMSFNHLHYQGFYKKTELERIMDDAKNYRSLGRAGGVDYFIPEAGTYPIDSIVIVQGADKDAVAQAAVDACMIDGNERVIQKKSKYTYNVLLSFEDDVYRAYIVYKNLIASETDGIDANVVLDDSVIGGGGDEVIFNGRPATVEMVDTLIYDGYGKKKAYDAIVSSDENKRAVYQAVMDTVRYHDFASVRDAIVRHIQSQRADVASEIKRICAEERKGHVVALHRDMLSEAFVETIENVMQKTDLIHIFIPNAGLVNEKRMVRLLGLPNVTIHTAVNEALYADVEFAESFVGVVRQLHNDDRVIASYSMLERLSAVLDPEQLPMLFLSRTKENMQEASDATDIALLPFALMDEEALKQTNIIAQRETKDSIPVFFELNFRQFTNVDFVGLAANVIREAVEEAKKQRIVKMAA